MHLYRTAHFLLPLVSEMFSVLISTLHSNVSNHKFIHWYSLMLITVDNFLVLKKEQPRGKTSFWRLYCNDKGLRLQGDQDIILLKVEIFFRNDCC